MKVVFCIDDNPRYLDLLKVAVRSLRAVQGMDAPCLCVYAGDNAHVLDSAAREHSPLARYRPRLNRETMPKFTHGCIGCFLKLELALVPELEDDETVLYCDADMLFLRPLDALFAAPPPPYMSMAREYTAPFFHEHPSLDYSFRQQRYTVSMPFPIWTFSSGVTLFNLGRLRKRQLVEHFLAFSQQNIGCIGNLDQSLLNYFFGKRITRMADCWNCPPYRQEALDTGHIIHFHGPKPWDTAGTCLPDLRINHYLTMCEKWFGYLTPEERRAFGAAGALPRPPRQPASP